jgi:hypothetical protein
MLQLINCPRCEHDPREDGVDKENEGVGDSSGNTSSS